jgi:hypothetical protein
MTSGRARLGPPGRRWERCDLPAEGPARPAQLLAAAITTGADNAFDAADELQAPLPYIM